MQPWLAGLRTWQTMAGGVPGFFQPRVPVPWNLAQAMPLSELSFYDTAPLRDTLLELIDFDLLNGGCPGTYRVTVRVAGGEDHRGGQRDPRLLRGGFGIQ